MKPGTACAPRRPSTISSTRLTWTFSARPNEPSTSEKIMKLAKLKTVVAVGALLATSGVSGRAQSSADIDALKADMQKMQQNMAEMQKKIDALEKEKAEAAQSQSALEKSSPSIQEINKIAAGQNVGGTSPVADRGGFDDQQTAAQRPGNLAQDPK